MRTRTQVRLSMKAKIFAALVAAFLLCAVASAQDYHIRITHNSNLRAGYSLQSEIVESAPAGSVLNVVGQFNRWLKINRLGRDLWMADWIAYARVGSAESPASQPQPSQIDNCCFVDRQCISDADWVGGYWAFQSKQCPAPPALTISHAQTTTGSAISLPAGADNCCQASHAVCSSNEDWIRGYLAFQVGQCKHPSVVIDGSPRFVARVEAALDMLRDGAPAWYAYTVNELKHIRETNEGILGVDTSLRSFALPPSHTYLWNDADVESAIVWLAGVLVHEACHVYRDKAGYPYGTELERFREEVICQAVQIEALEVFDPQKRFSTYLQGLISDFFGRGHQL